ncbi:MAG TPA: acyl carrier protein [Vicinamibacteria bacterium]
MSNIEQQLRQFVVDNFLFGQAGDGLADSDSFLDHGIIDSMGVLELVGFLEENYGITVQDQELIPDNLDSISKVASFLQRKLQASA